jgi:hypothetical protein
VEELAEGDHHEDRDERERAEDEERRGWEEQERQLELGE